MEERALVEQEWECVLSMIPPGLEDSAVSRLALRRRREVAWAGHLPAHKALELYRLRWQIEIALKRPKGLLHLDHLRARHPELAATYLYAKILGALILDELCHRAPAFFLGGYPLLPQTAQPWRLQRLLMDGLIAAVRGTISICYLPYQTPGLRRHRGRVNGRGRRCRWSSG